MYIFSTSFVVDAGVHQLWYEFFTQQFLRELGGRKVVFCRVLNELSDGSYTYSLQVDVDDIADYQRVESQHIARCVALCAEMFGAQEVLHFSTLLKKIEL